MRHDVANEQGTAPLRDESKWRRAYWPPIYDAETARKAALNGAQAAFVVSGITALLAALAVFDILNIVDAWSFVDAALFAGLGFFIRRMSRVAAVLAMALFIFERVDAFYSRGVTSAVGLVALMLLIGFVSGVRGAFSYHSYRGIATLKTL